jgi:hypothetical protein
MAVVLEQEVMQGIGLGQNYRWYNGSGSCSHIRRKAVDQLVSVAEKKGLQISSDWVAHCRKATRVDQVGSGQFGLTNTWIACSYAIQDAIYRHEGGEGYDPPTGEDHWYFFSKDDRREWKMMQSGNRFSYD